MILSGQYYLFIFIKIIIKKWGSREKKKKAWSMENSWCEKSKAISEVHLKFRIFKMYSMMD